MKIAIRKIVDAKDSLTKLMSTDLSLRTAYAINKLIKNVQPELTFLEEERQKLVKKYGETDENGNIRVKEDSLELFTEDINDVLDLEVEIAGIPLCLDISLEELKISAKDIFTLEDIVTIVGVE